MLGQGVKVKMLGRQNERNNSYVWLVHTSIFGLCFIFSLPNEIKLLLFNIFFFVLGRLFSLQFVVHLNKTSCGPLSPVANPDPNIDQWHCSLLSQADIFWKLIFLWINTLLNHESWDFILLKLSSQYHSNLSYVFLYLIA